MDIQFNESERRKMAEAGQNPDMIAKSIAIVFEAIIAEAYKQKTLGYGVQ